MAIPLRRTPLETQQITERSLTPRERRALLLQEITIATLRIVAGFLFIQHGVQKIFGLLLPASQPFTGVPPIFSAMWFAGTLELVGGLLMVLGFLTRPVAFLLAGEMAVAYFAVHAPQGFWPILNQGELAALYCFIFLAFSTLGAGSFSLDALLGRWRRQSPALVQ